MKQLLFLTAALICLAAPLPVRGEAAEQQTDSGENSAVAMFHGRALFELVDISSMTAQNRAERLTGRLRQIARSRLTATDSLMVDHNDELNISAIMLDGHPVIAVWEADARHAGVPRRQLAEEWCRRIREVIEQWRQDYTKEHYVRGAVFAVLTTAVLAVILFVIRRLCRKELQSVEKRFAGRKMMKVLDGESIIAINGYLMKLVRLAVTVVALVIYLNSVLAYFPWTYNLSAHLFGMISSPLVGFGRAFIDSLPGLFAIAVIIFIAHMILRGVRHIFMQIGEGKVRIRGFYQDWAETTYSLVRIVVVVFAAVVAFPYIPGSSSPAFKGISIFMGVLVSLGSTSAVGNIFGNLMLTYMRSFQTGDFVEINGQQGTVMARRTLSTRMKTRTNEVISIPNALVAANPIINYSRMTKSVGVHIGTDVTIGYDVPWRTVHELLLKSAEGVTDVLKEPQPAVLQLALDDFFVKYKLVVSTQNPAGKLRILSDLHQNIQDNFAAAGVEIMSPHYRANRSGEQITIPPGPGIPESSPAA